MSGQNDEQKAWIERFMRLGFVAKGGVYGTIGVLAFQSAIAAGGQTTDSQGALKQLAAEPLGRILLVVIAIGLVGLALWYIVRGVRDLDREGDEASGIGKRIGFVGAGLAYGVLAFTAFSILTGAGGGGGGEDSTADWTAMVMQQPFGRWLVGLVGVGFVGFGLYQIYKAYTTKFREELESHEMSATELTWGVRIARLGFTARGVVYGIIGIFLARAALQFDPEEAGGIAKALQELARQPYGAYLLGAVAAGLICYALYCILVLARYRQIRL